MHFVYILQSQKFSEHIYIGYTVDVFQRLKKHNQKSTFHTAKYAPWNLHSYFAFPDKSIAINFENYLKSHSGRTFIRKRILNNIIG